MLDELPSLEFAATGVAVVLSLRALRLAQRVSLDHRRSRVESGRARDLVGLAILVGALVYAVGAARASTWFLVASGVAIAAQLCGFYLRARPAPARVPSLPGAEAAAGPELEVDDQELYACPQCGHGTLIEIDDPAALLGGLHRLTAVSAVICPSCGALSGQVEDPAQIPIGAEHGTSRRQSESGDDQQALEEPREHEG